MPITRAQGKSPRTRAATIRPQAKTRRVRGSRTRAQYRKPGASGFAPRAMVRSVRVTRPGALRLPGLQELQERAATSIEVHHPGEGRHPGRQHAGTPATANHLIVIPAKAGTRSDFHLRRAEQTPQVRAWSHAPTLTPTPLPLGEGLTASARAVARPDPHPNLSAGLTGAEAASPLSGLSPYPPFRRPIPQFVASRLPPLARGRSLLPAG